MENNIEERYNEILKECAILVKRYGKGDKQKPEKVTSLHDGHRKRLDEKALESFDTLSMHEYLEILLFVVIPRGNTNDIAHRLLERFGSFKGVLNASPFELMKVKGVGYRAAMFLCILNGIAGLILRCQMNYTTLDNAEKIRDYVSTYFIGREKECSYVFLLDSHNKLKGVKLLSEGVSDETYIYASNICELALARDAKKVILAHNHPSGVATASENDVAVSKNLEIKLHNINVKLIDSVIVTDGDYYSLRANGHLEGRLIWGN